MEERQDSRGEDEEDSSGHLDFDSSVSSSGHLDFDDDSSTGGGEDEGGHDFTPSPPPPPAAATLQPQSTLAPIHIAPPPLAAAADMSSLSSNSYTNRISLFLFLLHQLVAAAAISFFIFKAVQGAIVVHDTRWRRRSRRLLRHWLPPVEAAALLSVVLALAWQRAVRAWPSFMVPFILWSAFAATMAAGILLLCFSLPATDGVGVALLLFSIGTGLYCCWVTHRVRFTAKLFTASLQPAAKFKDLNAPAYNMILVGYVYISLWCVAVAGAASSSAYYPGGTVVALVLSLAWTVEVQRNVVNLTASRVVALYYLRGMQCSARFSLHRAGTLNLGSAALGSLFVPTLEFLRIVARCLNLLEGEDEFMFSCAHCCLRLTDSVFRRGNGWAFVHIAAYGRGFAAASRTTWGMFEARPGMEALVDADITSSLCFLAGVCSGALCAIAAASWEFAERRAYTATAALLAFFVGYLMTRIGMALPHACVACYYVCYAENPASRLFDATIPDRLKIVKNASEAVVSTPRFPRRQFSVA